jgi:hypothetical protein
MSCTREQIVAQCQAWLGLKESNGSHKKIIDVYNSHKPRARGYKLKYNDAWCAGFVSAVAIQCGATDIIPLEVGCGKMRDKAKKMGIWVEADDHDPLPGDIILYNWKDSGKGDLKTGASHVGYVETVSETKFVTIEGNYSNKVKRRNMKKNGKYIRGFITPMYDDSPEEMPELDPSEIKNGDTVMVKKGAKQYNGKGLASFVYKRKHKVKDVKADRAVITYGGVVVAAVNVADLEIV